MGRYTHIQLSNSNMSLFPLFVVQVRKHKYKILKKIKLKKRNEGGKRWRKDGIKADQERKRILNISTYHRGRCWTLHPTTTTYCTIATTATRQLTFVVNGITAAWPVIFSWRWPTTATAVTPAIIGSTRQIHSDPKTI